MLFYISTLAVTSYSSRKLRKKTKMFGENFLQNLAFASE